MLDRRAFTLGAMLSGPLTIVMAGEAVGNTEFLKARNAAWIETSIREGTEDVSNEWYMADLRTKPSTQEVLDRSRTFYRDLRNYLSMAVDEKFIDNWHITHSLSGPIYIHINHRPDGEVHTFDLNWPYSTGLTALV